MQPVRLDELAVPTDGLSPAPGLRALFASRGRRYYNGTLHNLRVYAGSAWDTISLS